MKQCSKCHIEKPATEFFVKSRATGKLHAQCKACYKEHRKTYAAEHYQKYGDLYRQRAKLRRAKIKRELHIKLRDYLEDKSCEICGENDSCVLEFDHLDPREKSFGIAKGITDGRSWEEILTEIQKCRILCANCHKRHTAKQQGWFKAQNPE